MKKIAVHHLADSVTGHRVAKSKLSEPQQILSVWGNASFYIWQHAVK